MRCVEPAIRAVSLLHARGATARGDAMITAGGLGQECAAAALGPEGLLLLLPPGPVAAALRRDSVPCRGSFDALQRTASPAATGMPGAASPATVASPAARVHGTLALAGRLRSVPAPERRGAALTMAEHHPVEELLDALTHRGGWVLAVLELTGATWQLPCGVFALDVAGLLAADADPVLKESLNLCTHLNDSHRSIATSLAGEQAFFAEVDSDGATLGVLDRDGYVRVGWPHPCLDTCDVLDVLRQVSTGRLGV